MKFIIKTSFSLAAIALILAGGCSLSRPSEPVTLVPDNQSATSTEEVIDTSDWQTYRNEEMGFEMKVPKEWSENETKKENEWIFETADVTIDISSVRTTSSLEEVKNQKASEYMAIQFDDMKKIHMIGMEGYRHHSFYNPSSFTDEYFYNDVILLMGSGICTEIEFYSYSGSKDSEGSIISDSKKWEVMLKTLKRF